ncbi:hypothetical protein PFNF135_00012 [Plasmodium falciparum NF135/5.C10]|uniref:Surface antigen n=1 Tax=Plasmodium falciparum NF135/5.C10 TaxID=1036726 RepID=W4IQT1_PLAFA|nr:hypothetical protein PFNF135_00012 [Plasmodium falciparum NF135/5.C10]
MKLHYSKILLFSLPLNILVSSSSNAHNNKPYIKSHTSTTTWRGLSEYDPYIPNYDNDAEMKSVKENFDRQTSQRFDEYEERMKGKRQKRGGVAPVWGLISGLWYATWSQYVSRVASKAAVDVGVRAAIEGLKEFYSLPKIISVSEIEEFVTPTNYFHKMSFVTFVQKVNSTKCVSADASKEAFCDFVTNKGPGELYRGAARIAEIADQTAKDTVVTETAKYASQTTTYSTAIIASIVAIVVIVLVMVIIFLILRYRRKMKMNKKLQYTKLLNE